MKLLTKEIERKLPKLCEQDGKGDDATVYCKFFDPYDSWTWYVLEYDGVDNFFGWVVGLENEYGYFSKKELASIMKFGRPCIERDRYFEQTTLGEVKKLH